MEHQFRFIQNIEQDILSLTKKYHLSNYINDVYKGANWVMYNWTRRNAERENLERFRLLYLLKYSNPLKGIKVKGVIDNQDISFSIYEGKLVNNLIIFLEDSINDETKDFYYNQLIIKEKEQTISKEDKKRVALYKLQRSGKELNSTQTSFLNNCTSDEISEADRYEFFFSKDNLRKIIDFENKQSLKIPSSKGKVVGYYANMLFEKYKYSVFGYNAIQIDFIECPDIEENKTNKRIWNKFRKDIKEQNVLLEKHDEAAYAHITLYNQYIFIYEILSLLKIIKREDDNNKAKYHYIRDCLSS